MEIIVTEAIRKREFGRTVPEDAKKLFEKLKERPALAVSVSAPNLPPRTSLYKVYATTEHGARRLLFFLRRPVPAVTPPGSRPPPAPVERWALLLYRNKEDKVGRNLAPGNPAYGPAVTQRLTAALNDLTASTAAQPKFEIF